MLLLRTDSLPSGEQWLYELKLDGYRAIAFKRSGDVSLRSRNDNDFSGRYPAVAKALQKLPADTVVDGEIVASIELECRPVAIANFEAAPFEIAIERRMLQARERDRADEPRDRRAIARQENG